MRFTWRLTALFAAGIVFFLLIGLSDWFAVAGIVYDGLLVALAFADLLLTANPAKSWELVRRMEDRLSLGAQNRITVELRFTGERVAIPKSVLVRDEPPLEFDITDKSAAILAFNASGRDQRFGYYVHPPAKGDFRFGETSIRYDGALGLIARVHTFPTSTDIKVYPNLQDTEKYDILARKGLLQQLGIRTMRMRGGGSEFESLREYVAGDEYRNIDWSATARRNKLITRQYQAERSQNVILAIDTGRTMLQPIHKITKLDYVINTALMLAYVASRSDDKVGLFVFDSETRVFFPPAKSKGQLYRILGSLYNVEAGMTESDYFCAFNDVTSRWRRRSLFVLFTDLVDPESSAGILGALPLVEKKYRSLCVTVSDPNITAAASLMPETEADVYQKAVAMQTLHERRAAINIMKRRGIWSVDSPPETLNADLINRYTELKARSAI